MSDRTQRSGRTHLVEQGPEKRGGIYRQDGSGGIRLASNVDRWSLHEDYVHLAPNYPATRFLKWDAELHPVVDAPERQALVIIDMQNDFCEPGGWTDASGLDYEGCREAIPGVQRAVDAARDLGIQVVWLYWHNRPDLRNMGAPVLYSFKHKPGQKGIGEPLENGPVLTEGSWGAQMVSDLQDYMSDDDWHVEKYRMSGFWGTHFDQVLRTQGIQTLWFSGVNIDQCVTSTMQDAYFRDYNCILLEDASATSSPDYAKQGVVFNAKNCWGFNTTTEKMANPEEFNPQEG